MDWKNHLEKNLIRKIKKSKNQSESKILFKHRFLTLL